MKKILLRSPNWLGDGVMAFPAVKVLRERFPEAELWIVTRHYLADLWAFHPAVDRVVDVGHSKREELRKALGLRREGFDLYLTFPRSFIAALTGVLAGAKKRVGYKAEGRGWLLTVALPEDGQRRHRVEGYLRLLEPFGEVPQTFPPEIEVEACLLEGVRGLTAGEKLVVFNTGATYGEAKCWPPERFVELGRGLIRRGLKIALVGGPKEVERNRRIAREVGQGIMDLTGRTTIRQLAALLKMCHCLVTNDTGPMHLAAAVGTPVVALFGSTDPSLTGPLGEGHKVIRREIPCSPCFKRVCPEGHHQCMERISADEVQEAVWEIMKNA